MSTAKSPKGSAGQGHRLGTQLRGERAIAYEARGQSSADLMLHYSPKAQKDVVLTGQLQFLNFFDLRIRQQRQDGQRRALLFHCQCSGWTGCIVD